MKAFTILILLITYNFYCQEELGYSFVDQSRIKKVSIETKRDHLLYPDTNQYEIINKIYWYDKNQKLYKIKETFKNGSSEKIRYKNNKKYLKKIIGKKLTLDQINIYEFGREFLQKNDTMIPYQMQFQSTSFLTDENDSIVMEIRYVNSNQFCRSMVIERYEYDSMRNLNRVKTTIQDNSSFIEVEDYYIWSYSDSLDVESFYSPQGFQYQKFYYKNNIGQIKKVETYYSNKLKNPDENEIPFVTLFQYDNNNIVKEEHLEYNKIVKQINYKYDINSQLILETERVINNNKENARYVTEIKYDSHKNMIFKQKTKDSTRLISLFIVKIDYWN